MARRSVRAGAALAAVLVLGLVACGGDDAAPVATGADSSGSDGNATGNGGASVEMPDLVGLTETEAVQQLRSLDIDDVTVESQESLEAPGTVLKQVPSAGARVVGGVTVVVATSLPVNPDWVGKNLAEARAWYELRGVTVVEEDELTNTAAAGTVVRTTPAGGEPVGTEVIVAVARRSFAQAFSEFEWLDRCGNTAVGDADVNGDTYPRSVIMNGNRYYDELRESGCSVDVNLSRDWHTFKATIGLRDDSDPESTVRFEVLADGEAVYRENVGFGQTKEVNVAVNDVLRLRIIATSETSDFEQYAVWGEPTLVGPPPEGVS